MKSGMDFTSATCCWYHADTTAGVSPGHARQFPMESPPASCDQAQTIASITASAEVVESTERVFAARCTQVSQKSKTIYRCSFTNLKCTIPEYFRYSENSGALDKTGTVSRAVFVTVHVTDDEVLRWTSTRSGILPALQYPQNTMSEGFAIAKAKLHGEDEPGVLETARSDGVWEVVVAGSVDCVAEYLGVSRRAGAP